MTQGVYPPHPWLQVQEVAFVPRASSPLTDWVMEGLARTYRALGHRVVDRPRPEHTTIVVTSAPYGEDVYWKEALLFNLRRLYGMRRVANFWTVVTVSPRRFREDLARIQQALADGVEGLSRLQFAGLAPSAAPALWEQGRRGGPIAVLERVVQTQAKSIRVLLVVGDEQPQEAYVFDLVGAYPRIPFRNEADFLQEIVLRMVTVASTRTVSQHQMQGEPIPRQLWEALTAPRAMMQASRAFAQRDFFSPMVRIADFTHVPGALIISAMIAEQYSEGCFATWEPQLDALVATVTGSARPVHKGSLEEKDLAVIVGVRPDGMGAYYRPVEGLPNDPPSSEAVELYGMDEKLPRISWQGHEVPVTRSKLHGHRGVAAYDPKRVEFVPLEEVYHHYPVTCASEAQALAVKAAFQRAACLRNPEDPRTLAFTIIPCHGVIIVEKWVPGKEPFQEIWEAMDQGALEMSLAVPQGPFGYRPGPDGRMHYTEDPAFWPWRREASASETVGSAVS